MSLVSIFVDIIPPMSSDTFSSMLYCDSICELLSSYKVSFTFAVISIFLYNNK